MQTMAEAEEEATRAEVEDIPHLGSNEEAGTSQDQASHHKAPPREQGPTPKVPQRDYDWQWKRKDITKEQRNYLDIGKNMPILLTIVLLTYHLPCQLLKPVFYQTVYPSFQNRK